ncbi:hypothetical protein B0H13DRAFT_1910512 [Mycena leptocephala]|nr:hypothetical protein B0H13DRAFT_1910512 [Mycena leptocephala]
MKLSSNDKDDWSSMPDLKSVSGSEEEEVAPSGWDLPQPIYGDPEETFENRLHVWEQAIAYQDKRLSNPLPRAHRIGDILGHAAASLLEFLQPCPGDERISWADERQDSRRFKLDRAEPEFYIIHDNLTDVVSILPLEYLRVPHFQLGKWYACHLALQLDIRDFEPSKLLDIEISRLLEAGVGQYFEEIRRHLPSIGHISIEKVV